MNKELKSTLREMQAPELTAVINFSKELRAEKRVAATEERAQLKARLAELTEKRNRGEKVESPKKGKKGKRSKKEAEA